MGLTLICLHFVLTEKGKKKNKGKDKGEVEPNFLIHAVLSYTSALVAPNLVLTFRAVNARQKNVNFTVHTVNEIKA